MANRTFKFATRRDQRKQALRLVFDELSELATQLRRDQRRLLFGHVGISFLQPLFHFIIGRERKRHHLHAAAETAHCKGQTKNKTGSKKRN